MSNITNAQNLLKESKAFPANILKEIAILTDLNHHNLARILLARTIKNKKLEKAYQGISNLADYYGHMPQDLGKIRYDIDKKMFKHVKQTYSNGQDVYMSF